MESPIGQRTRLYWCEMKFGVQMLEGLKAMPDLKVSLFVNSSCKISQNRVRIRISRNLVGPQFFYDFSLWNSEDQLDYQIFLFWIHFRFRDHLWSQASRHIISDHLFISKYLNMYIMHVLSAILQHMWVVVRVSTPLD